MPRAGVMSRAIQAIGTVKQFVFTSASRGYMQNVVSLLEHDGSGIFEPSPRLSCTDFGLSELARGKDLKNFPLGPNEIAVLVDDNERYHQSQPTRGILIPKMRGIDSLDDHCLLDVMMTIFQLVRACDSAPSVQEANKNVSRILARTNPKKYWTQLALARAFTCGWEFQQKQASARAKRGGANPVDDCEDAVASAEFSRQSELWALAQRLPADLWAEGRKEALPLIPKHFRRGMRMLARKREKEVSAASTKELDGAESDFESKSKEATAMPVSSLRTSTGSDVYKDDATDNFYKSPKGGGETKWLENGERVYPQRFDVAATKEPEGEAETEDDGEKRDEDPRVRREQCATFLLAACMVGLRSFNQYFSCRNAP